MGHGVTLGLPTTPVHLVLGTKVMEAVAEKSKGEAIWRKRTTWGESSLCSDALSSEKPRTNEGN